MIQPLIANAVTTGWAGAKLCRRGFYHRLGKGIMPRLPPEQTRQNRPARTDRARIDRPEEQKPQPAG